jgi:8-oxo-dGTP pyrophosphatase MutT (NUDIX family)
MARALSPEEKEELKQKALIREVLEEAGTPKEEIEEHFEGLESGKSMFSQEKNPESISRKTKEGEAHYFAKPTTTEYPDSRKFLR